MHVCPSLAVAEVLAILFKVQTDYVLAAVRYNMHTDIVTHNYSRLHTHTPSHPRTRTASLRHYVTVPLRD